MASEQNKRVLNNTTQQIVVSSRWNPTPEQLQTLEELYRRGTRTPSAEQIQLITAQLRRYGKIEGKNVFYWFQNHKARERQKRRRQLDQPPPLDDREKKESLTGANRSVYEVEQTMNWASPTKSSTIAPEKQGGRAGSAATECKGADDGWLQFDYNNNNNNNNNNVEEEPATAATAEEISILQQQRKNATWQQMMHLSCSSSSSPPISSSTTTTTSAAIPSTTMVMPKDKYFNILLEPYTTSNYGTGGEAATQTLQLFPLFTDGDGDGDGDEKHNASTMMDSTTNHVTPYPFFEFLPLKN